MLRFIKTVSMSWVGHVAHIVRMRNLWEDFVGKLKEWGQLGDLGKCLEDIIKKGWMWNVLSLDVVKLQLC